jgi:hypothetical protein
VSAIVKRRYETGEFGNVHFKVTPAILAEMKRSAPAPEPETHTPPWSPGYGIGALTGISVLVDEGLPEGTWRLVDNSTGAVVHEGVVPRPSDG